MENISIPPSFFQKQFRFPPKYDILTKKSPSLNEHANAEVLSIVTIHDYFLQVMASFGEYTHTDACLIFTQRYYSLMEKILWK